MIVRAVLIALIGGQWCTQALICSVLCKRVVQLMVHGRRVVSCTSEIQSVVGWKLAMAGPQKRLSFSLGYLRKVNIC